MEILSVGFIKLFLFGKHIISLEEAASKLLPLPVDESKIKTRIRRLYDIANVFKSIGIIKKTQKDNYKSLYEYVGLKGIDSFINETYPNSKECNINSAEPLNNCKRSTIITQNNKNHDSQENQENLLPNTSKTDEKIQNSTLNFSSFSHFKMIKRKDANFCDTIAKNNIE